jgi:hypothetical protein
MAINATLGSSTANAYASEADADAYAAVSWWGSTWLALSADAKQIALIAATSALETLTWKGKRCDPSTDNADKPQALSWPRSGVSCDGVAATCTLIPAAITDACIELSYQLSQNPSALQPGAPSAAASGTYTSKEKLGDLEVNYAAYPAGATGESCSSCSDPKVISMFPWLKGMVSCYAVFSSTSGSKVILRVRS